jgi:hypothetical protein
MTDESFADDGALYAFWDFVRLRRELGRADYDLEDLVSFRAAIDAFEAGDLT